MQHNFQLKEWVKRCYCPVVMCATTPSVDEICSKNNVNFVQLLEPFSQLDNIRIYPYKLESGQSPPKQITSLSLRFVSIHEISSTSQDTADVYLAEYCRKLAPNAPTQLSHLKNHKKKKAETGTHSATEEKANDALRICSVCDVDNFFLSNPDPTPWFSLYQKKFLSTLRFNDYEFLDAPIAVMYVASTRDDDPVDKLRKLSSKTNLPTKFKTGIYSSDMHKVFILLHDKHDIDLRSRVQFLFQNICKTFDGASCKLLHINSNALKDANYDTIDLWQQHINHDMIDQYPVPKAILKLHNHSHGHEHKSWSRAKNYYKNNKTNKHGIYLSDQDVSVLTQFVSDFAIYGCIPFIEKKISKLYQSISKQRRGTINTFKTWIRSTKTKPHIEERKKNRRNFAPIYELHTIESQIRQLADLAFIFQQYHVALDHYKLCQADYENDQCREYLCGCLEMSGLCCALLSNAISTPSWMRHDKNKHKHSEHDANHTTMNELNHNIDLDMNIIPMIDRREMEKYYDQSFRTYCDLSLVRLATRTCIWAWMSHCSLGHSFNNDMISNVLLRPSEKETKHRSAMLLEQAAFAYLRAGHDRSPCIRKYAFHLILAAHLYKECEQKQHSIRCYSRAMMVYAERGWNHIEDHINYNLGYLSSKVLRYNPAIQYFLELLGEGRGSATRQKNFLDKFISIIAKWPNNNYNNYNQNQQVHKSKSIIKQIGMLSSNSISKTLKFVPNLNIPKFDANQILIVLCDPNLEQREYCIVGEPIIVQLPIHNPLKRDLMVSNLCLHIEIEDTNQTLQDKMLGYEDLFQYEPSNVRLSASETQLFALSIIPSSPLLCGLNIRLVGIRWQIFDSMQGFYKFDSALKEIKLSSPLSQCSFLRYGAKSIATFQRDHRSIEYYLQDTDSKCNLMFHISQPIAHIKCSFGDCNPFPSHIYYGELCPVIMRCTNVSKTITAHHIQLKINKASFLTICDADNRIYKYHDHDHTIVHLDQDIKPQQSMQLMIWVYGSQIGRHLIQFVLSYVTKDKALKRRTIISRYLTVNPFMNLSLFTKDHFGDINQYILGIEIENNDANHVLIDRGQAVDLKSIQLADMSVEEKQSVILPANEHKSSQKKKKNVVRIEYIGCCSSTWSIERLIKDSVVPNIDAMSTFTTFLRLIPKRNGSTDMSAVRFAMGNDDDSILNPLSDVCQNIFKLKQKEHQKRLRHIAKVFHHIRQKHKNELEVIVSFKIEMNENEAMHEARYGYLLLREPFVFARHETTSNCPLRVALKYPKKLPIVSALPIECDVTLMVLNTGTKYVSFTLETLKRNEEFDSHARSFIVNENPSQRSKYKWIGNNKFDNQILEPGGYSSYDLKSQFNEPGIYNLNRYRFIVQTHSGQIDSIKKTSPSKIFFFPTQHLIVVGARN